MKITIDKDEVEVVITRKRTNKNTYLRVKEDLNIYVTTNYYTRDRDIEKLVKENIQSIQKMRQRQLQKRNLEEEFFYLGKKYDIVYLNFEDIILGKDKLFVSKDFDLDKWLLERAKIIFQEEFDKMYHSFPYKIPYPKLKIRKMKTRWGVCNIKSINVTLNLELIKMDIKYLDYVIVHELSHLIHPNHSKDFWKLVEQMIPDYKVLRKEMR